MKSLLNLEGVKALSKMEQKSINGGSVAPEGGCCVYDAGWMCGYSVEDAQWLYNNESSVTGYCCASC